MTLPVSGVIGMSDVNVELGKASTTNTTLNSSDVRQLFQKTTPDTNISLSDGYGKSNSFLPTGIIVPYNSTGAIPTGFSQFSSANDRYIVGAGSSYGVNTTGGSSSISISGTTTTNTAHTGPGGTCTYSYQGGGGSINTDVNARGAHNHTFSGSSTYAAPARRTRLIKATQNVYQLPQGVAVMKHTAGGFTGLTRVTGINTYNLQGHASALDITGSYTASVAVSSGSGGSHVAHHTIQGSPYTYYAAPINTAGDHTHTSTFTASANPPYRYLALYQAATANIPLPPQNIIGMWESNTPPTGWAVCDGANGTPDMRNYFVRFLDGDTSINTTGGSTSMSFSGTFSATPNHNHGNSNLGSIFTFTGYHVADFQMETHTGSASATYVPPYYALIFIMRL